MMSTNFESHNFFISNQWDGSPIDHPPITMSISKDPNDASNLRFETQAPFFDDPGKPQGKPGQPFQQLWDYEVVEAFFLGENEKYLEIELCPHGQHLVLMLHGVRNVYKTELPLDFQSVINPDERTWKGCATIPKKYFPPGLKLFNAYAIHGTGDGRVYEALYHTPKGAFPNPDFHRLQYFKEVDFDVLIPKEIRSALWDGAI